MELEQKRHSEVGSGSWSPFLLFSFHSSGGDITSSGQSSTRWVLLHMVGEMTVLTHQSRLHTQCGKKKKRTHIMALHKAPVSYMAIK